MTYTENSSLLKSSGHHTAQQLYAAFEPMIPSDQKADARQALDTIVVLCKELHIDEIAAAAIVWIETGAPGTGLPFRSKWWRERKNLGNLGVTGDDAQNEASQSWSTPEDAAYGLVAHLVAYVYGDAWRAVWDVDEYGKPQTWDKRFDLVLREYKGQQYTTLEGLNGRWAWDVDGAYGKKLAERANKLEAAMSPPVEVPSTPEEPVEPGVPMPATLDYSSLSFPVEVRLIRAGQTTQRPGTPMVPRRTTWHDTGNPGYGARADMHAAWMEGGCRDNNGNPTYTSWHFTVDDGKAIQHIPLNEVAWHAGDGGNGPGNTTSIGIEECVNSDRDAAKTRRNAAELHAFLVKSLGLTGGVGAVVQHNYWSGKNCPAVIRGAGLWPSMQSLITGFLGTSGGGQTPVYADADPVAKGSRIINGHVFLAPGGKTFQADVDPRKYADKDQPITGAIIKKGTKITQDQISHYVQGTDGNLWVILTGVPGVKDGARVPAGALISDAA